VIGLEYGSGSGIIGTSHYLQEVVEVVGPALAFARQPGDAGAERLPLGVVQVDARQLPRPVARHPWTSTEHLFEHRTGQAHRALLGPAAERARGTYGVKRGLQAAQWHRLRRRVAQISAGHP